MHLRESFQLRPIEPLWFKRFVDAFANTVAELHFGPDGELNSLDFDVDRPARIRLHTGAHLAPMTEYQLRITDDLGIPTASHAQIKDWNEHVVAFGVIHNTVHTGVTVRRHHLFGLQEVVVETQVNPLSKIASWQIEGSFDAEKLFTGQRQVAVVHVRSSLGRMTCAIEVERVAETWDVTIDMQGGGRGLFIVIAWLPLAILSKTLAKWFKETVEATSEELNRRVRLSTRHSPETEARRLLRELLFGAGA